MPYILLPYLAVLLAIAGLIALVLRDLHLSKKLARLERVEAEQRRIIEKRGQLANEVAHEIKNPITAILCSAETLDLLIGDTLHEDHRRALKYIREYGDNLLRLVSDFLDVSRAEAGNISTRPQVVKVAPLVESIIGLLESNAIRKHIQLKTFIPNEALLAWADPKHLKQILFNLVHNAIKFTPEQGEIHVVVKSDLPDPTVRFSIRDNGPGIAQEDLYRIFDPYVHRESGDGHYDTGAGLGLSLCKSLVELIGGDIFVDSQVGVGTCFEFCIPEHKAEQKQISEGPMLDNLSDSTSLTTSKPLLGQSFLVVDEDAGSRESIAQLIEAWGGMVDRVGLAVDAVEALAHKQYDAVMLDDTLDGVYGHELARILKDDADRSQTTIIIASKSHVDEDAVKDCGADKFIEKPLNGRVLLSSLLNSGKYTVTH